MSKAVMRTAKPYWIYLILTGKKTVEAGKDFPKSEDWNKTVEMYCSKDMRSFKRIPKEDREWMRKYLGKVACRFVCDTLFQVAVRYLLDKDSCSIPQGTCLNYEEIVKYIGNKTLDESLHFWGISKLVIYDKPRELEEFERECFENFYKGIGSKICHNCEHYLRTTMYEPCDCKKDGYKPLTRAPQSWCYIFD